MTSCMLVSRRWASPNIYSTWISMESPYRGTCLMWVVPEVSVIRGCHILMMRTPSSSLARLVLLTRYVSLAEHVLCSISCTGIQYLEEDPRTNRIDDSLQLFTQICSNQLLKRVHLVLFLSMSRRTHFHNVDLIDIPSIDKTDILRKKLEQGLSVSK